MNGMNNTLDAMKYLHTHLGELENIDSIKEEVSAESAVEDLQKITRSSQLSLQKPMKCVNMIKCK